MPGEYGEHVDGKVLGSLHLLGGQRMTPEDCSVGDAGAHRSNIGGQRCRCGSTGSMLGSNRPTAGLIGGPLGSVSAGQAGGRYWD